MILGPQVCPAVPLALSYLWTSCHLREPLGPAGDLWVRTSVHTVLDTVQHPHGADQIWGAEGGSPRSGAAGLCQVAQGGGSLALSPGLPTCICLCGSFFSQGWGPGTFRPLLSLASGEVDQGSERIIETRAISSWDRSTSAQPWACG